MLTPYQRKYIEFLSTVQAVPPVPCEFKVGDKVTFTNEYGISFPGNVIVGFATAEEMWSDHFIYLDNDCYWFAKTPDSLSLSADESEVEDGEQSPFDLERFQVLSKLKYLKGKRGFAGREYPQITEAEELEYETMLVDAIQNIESSGKYFNTDKDYRDFVTKIHIEKLKKS